jgi:hypothetical protein
MLKSKLGSEVPTEDKIALLLHIIAISSDVEMWASLLLWLAENGGIAYQ